MHVVLPPIRLPQRLFDRFPWLFVVMFPDLSPLPLLPTPFVDNDPPPATQAQIEEMTMLATVLAAAATVLLQARAAVAAIQVPRAEISAVMATAARKRLPQLLRLLLMFRLLILPSLP
jgi:hypothetical protein